MIKKKDRPSQIKKIPKKPFRIKMIGSRSSCGMPIFVKGKR